MLLLLLRSRTGAHAAGVQQSVMKAGLTTRAGHGTRPPQRVYGNGRAKTPRPSAGCGLSAHHDFAAALWQARALEAILNGQGRPTVIAPGSLASGPRWYDQAT